LRYASPIETPIERRQLCIDANNFIHPFPGSLALLASSQADAAHLVCAALRPNSMADHDAHLCCVTRWDVLLLWQVSPCFSLIS